jgi:cysteine synthase
LKAARDILETVGNTPLVRINKLVPRSDVDIFAKLEGFNPLGSVKERIAVAMVEAAEREGKLTKEKILVESSSGNTGIGLAMVAAVKGYRLVVTMPDNVSVERRKILKALGAALVLTPGEKGTDGAWDKADEIYGSDPVKYYRIHQYKDPNNPRCHYETTGPEIWEQMEKRVDYFVVGLGTTGTLVGAGRFLKGKNPRLKVIAVEPTREHKQQGLRNLSKARVPDIFDLSVMDEKIVVADDEALEFTRRLASEEGIFAGISSGSAMWGAWQVAGKAPRGSRIAVLFPDRGDKYLSTNVFPE